MYQPTLRGHFYSTSPAPRLRSSKRRGNSKRGSKRSSPTSRMVSVPARTSVTEDRPIIRVQSLEYAEHDTASNGSNIAARIYRETHPKEQITSLSSTPAETSQFTPVRGCQQRQLIVRLKMPPSPKYFKPVEFQPVPMMSGIDSPKKRRKTSRHPASMAIGTPSHLDTLEQEVNTAANKASSANHPPAMQNPFTTFSAMLNACKTNAHGEIDKAIQAATVAVTERDTALEETAKLREELGAVQARAANLETQLQTIDEYFISRSVHTDRLLELDRKILKSQIEARSAHQQKDTIKAEKDELNQRIEKLEKVHSGREFKHIQLKASAKEIASELSYMTGEKYGEVGKKLDALREMTK